MHKQLISLGIAVILTLALLTLGGNSVSRLIQSSTWTDPVTHETEENPLRIEGFARTVNNIHVLISPFAQAEFHSHMLSELGTKEETSLIFKDCRQPPLTVIRAILSGQTGTSPAINRYAAKGSLHE